MRDAPQVAGDTRFRTFLLAIVVGLAMVPATGRAQSPPPTTAESTPSPSPTQAPPQPALTAVAATPTGASWSGKLSVQRCHFAAPELPAETEIALNATLIVRVPEGVGSAVLISPDGFALTAAHVVKHHRTVNVMTRTGTKLSATVVRVDETHDVALIKLNASGTTPCLAPVEGQVPLGSDVFVLGSPAGEELSFSVAKGIVSGYRSFEGVRFVQFDAAVNPGNSGGPAVSQAGQIIGITSWKLSHVSLEGLSFAVPCDVALATLDVELDAASSPDWATQTGRRDLPSSAAPTRPPTAVNHNNNNNSMTSAERQRRRIKRGFITAGAVSLGVGVISASATGAFYYVTREGGMTRSTWTALQAVNTVGWALAGIGAGALVVGIALPKQPKKNSTANLNLQLVPTATGALLQGSF